MGKRKDTRICRREVKVQKKGHHSYFKSIGGGVTGEPPCLLNPYFELCHYVFVLTQAVSNREIWFVKAVLILSEHGHQLNLASHGFCLPPILLGFYRVRPRLRVVKHFCMPAMFRVVYKITAREGRTRNSDIPPPPPRKYNSGSVVGGGGRGVPGPRSQGLLYTIYTAFLHGI